MGIPEHTRNNPARHVAIVIDLQYALPWHQDTYQGALRYGLEHGWKCSLDLHATGVDGDLGRCPYDGVVGRIKVDVAERLRAQGVSMVNLTRYVAMFDQERFKDLPGVYVDRAAGIRMAVEHLAQVGYPRLGVLCLVGFDQDLTIKIAKEASAEHGMKWVEPFLFPHDYAETAESNAAMLRELNRWLAAVGRPVGLLVNQNHQTRLVAHACIEHGLSVPEEAGVITPMGDRVTLLSGSPTITGVEHDYFRQGYEAAAMLDKLMRGEALQQPQVWHAPTEVVVRDSTDVFLCEDKLVSEAMRHIASHVRDDITVQELADAMEVSRATLYRRFEDVLGRPPQQEINRLRMDYIKRLMSETKMPIAEVCNACGFSTPSHFTRFFKRETGETPSAYRERLQRRDPSQNS